MSRAFAAAAHEINNPLAVIMGYAQLLADKVDAQGRGQIDEILEALSRIQEIVMRMKRVTRIELTEAVPYLPEMLDLGRSSEPDCHCSRRRQVLFRWPAIDASSSRC